MESNKNKFLKEQEEVWRLKIRVVWLASGDNNTQFFQSFAKGRKLQNTNWELNNSNNEVCSSFEDLDRISKSHFETLFKAENEETIAEVIHISQLFPRQISEEDNLHILADIFEDELKETLHIFQKVKIPGPDGWTINFFGALYYTIGPNLLHLVEEYRLN